MKKGLGKVGGLYFPDQNFKSYLLSNFDLNNDGEISEEEAAAITEVKCGNLGIRSLEGIEQLENLMILECGHCPEYSYDNHKFLNISKTLACDIKRRI